MIQPTMTPAFEPILNLWCETGIVAVETVDCADVLFKLFALALITNAELNPKAWLWKVSFIDIIEKLDAEVSTIEGMTQPYVIAELLLHESE